LLSRVASHVRGCWAKGVLPVGCSRVIPARGEHRDCGVILTPLTTDVVSQLLKTKDSCCDYFL